MALGLVFEGLQQGLQLVRIAGDLGLDGLVGFEFGGEFLEDLRGAVGHAGGLVTGNGFWCRRGDVGAAHLWNVADPGLVSVMQQGIALRCVPCRRPRSRPGPCP